MDCCFLKVWTVDINGFMRCIVEDGLKVDIQAS